MLRQSSSRIHRSRGSKVKHVLQVCFLVAVSLWLIYQVKHSHDKRKEFDETDATAQVKVQTSNLGRKDLHPRLEGTTTTNSIQKHDGEDEAEVEDNKHEDEQEPEQVESNSNEDRVDGIDEHDQEQPDTEDDEEDILDEEKKREEKGLQGVTDKAGQDEKESSWRDHDGNVGTRNAHEAREELYKADDASSEVTPETEAVNNRTGNGNLENSTGKIGNASLQEENTSLKEEDKGENGISSNVTEKGDNGNGTEENLFSNSTVTQEAFELPGGRDNTTEGSLVTDKSSLQNETDAKLGFLNEAQNATLGGSEAGQGQSSGTESNSNQSDSNLLAQNATIQEQSNTTVSELVEPEKVRTSNGSLELETHSESSTTEKRSNATHIEKLETRNGTDESLGSFRADSLQGNRVEANNSSSIHLEDENSRAGVDLGTLPEIVSEGSDKDDPVAG